MIDTYQPVLFTDTMAPPRSRADARAELAALSPAARRTDRGAYLAAVASGMTWTCPDQCTQARGDVCECPCGRRCHGARWCEGHR